MRAAAPGTLSYAFIDLVHQTHVLNYMGNAYAVLNTLTNIAARPPESTYFQKDRDTLEKRSGRWLKKLARQSQTTGFDLNRGFQRRNLGEAVA